VISRAAPQFWELYCALPPDVRAAARKAYQKFSESPTHPSLRLERLRSDRRAWSVRITRDYRAVALRSGEEWVWLWIGDHKEFDRRFPA
jgi:cell wall assembly regulator SMI1